MTLKRILAILVGSWLLCSCVMGADNQTVGVTVKTDPPGARVTLAGENVVVGVSPVHFRQPLIGNYQLKVERPGFETYTSDLILDPTKHTAVDVTLSRKTRFKALARSLFVPGWGQVYGDQKAKGVTLGLLAVGSGVAYLIADHHFEDKFDTFEARRAQYDSVLANGSIDELNIAWRRLNEAQDDAYDAENIRRVTIGAAIGVWAINVLDVLFFFPEERGTFSIKGVDVAVGGAGEQVGITLSMEF